MPTNRKVRATCIHCKRPDTWIMGRLLCSACYDTPRIRKIYPALRRGPSGFTDEPTAAEVDALVAEQMRPENLPSWWYDEQQRMAERRDHD